MTDNRWNSFCFEAILRLKPDTRASEVADSMNTWASDWTRQHRMWRSPLFDSIGGELDYFNDFLTPPLCRAGSEGTITVRLKGTPEASKYWRDWLALRLLPEMQKEFTAIEAIDGITECSEPKAK